MKKIVIFFCLLLIQEKILCISLDEIDSKIKTNSKSLQNQTLKENELSSNLDELAKKIVEQEKKLKDIELKLNILQKDIEKNSDNYKSMQSNLATLKEKLKKLEELRKTTEDQMVKLLVYKLTLSLAENSEGVKTQRQQMQAEVAKSLKKILIEEIKDLQDQYSKQNIQNAKYKADTDKLEKKIDKQKKNQDEYVLLKDKYGKDLISLNEQKDNYKKQLYKLHIDSQKIKDALEELSITRRNEVDRINELTRSSLANADEINIRQIGSSYQKSKTIKYKGAKTISPIDNFLVIRKFGTYYDPVYKIKIFNDGVTLRSKNEYVNVRSVLDGKVVFADKSPFLDRIVIIQSSNDMYIVYAQLIKMSPNLEVGAKIKKGYVIGKIKRDLVFEVTQKGYHMNPLDLIDN